MRVVVSTLAALMSALGSLAAVLGSAGLFGYLRYRAYLRTTRYLCDRHGLPAMREFLRHASDTRSERRRLARRDRATGDE
jgi:hypothetical protein